MCLILSSPLFFFFFLARDVLGHLCVIDVQRGKRNAGDTFILSDAYLSAGPCEDTTRSMSSHGGQSSC